MWAGEALCTSVVAPVLRTEPEEAPRLSAVDTVFLPRAFQEDAHAAAGGPLICPPHKLLWLTYPSSCSCTVQRPCMRIGAARGERAEACAWCGGARGAPSVARPHVASGRAGSPPERCRRAAAVSTPTTEQASISITDSMGDVPRTDALLNKLACPREPTGSLNKAIYSPHTQTHTWWGPVPAAALTRQHGAVPAAPRGHAVGRARPCRVGRARRRERSLSEPRCGLNAT